MKTGRIAAAIGLVVGGVLAAQPVFAQAVPFPTKAARYSAWMARTMDKCNAPVPISVVSGLPAAGCVQTNSATDSAITMNRARLNINRTTGKLALFGSGFQFGSRVTTQLRLRITKSGLQIPPTPGTTAVTFQDVTIECPATPFGFVARASGALAGSIKLTDCLSQSGVPTGLATGNIEILDAALINIDTGKVFARPGIIR